MIPNNHLQAVFDIWSQRGEETACRIAGDCMAPMIREGDSLTIEHGIRDFQVGDVVVFGDPGNISVNRVVHIEYKNGKRVFLVKGDQSWAFHPPIPGDRILGKVIEVSGSNGRLRLNSTFWRVHNYLLSIRSYISGKHLTADSLFWEGAHALFVLRSKILPQRFSIHLFLWRGVCLLYRIWSLIEIREVNANER
jgi:hypothetical protein